MTSMAGNRFRPAAQFRAELRQFLRRSEERSRAHGVTPKQYLLLLQIAGAENGETTVSELVETLALTQSAVTELVQRAEQAGFVGRRSGETDARVSHLFLTELGLAKLDRIHDELGPERKHFRELIERLLSEG
jgi:DNA-binding MarR family transcriptional regulator